MVDSRNKNCGTKTAEQKLQNKNSGIKIVGGPSDIGWWGPQVQVQKGQQNKTAEQNQQNKNWWGQCKKVIGGGP